MAELILANRFGLDIEQLQLRHKVARFEHLTKLNSRIKTNAVHIMLNFDPSEKLDAGKLQALAANYMEKIGFSEQPFLVYRHEDAHHPHLHIVSTNVKPDASRMDLHNIGKTLSEKARKEIEKEYQLIHAGGRSKDQQIIPIDINVVSYRQKPTKRSIYNVVTAVLRSYKFSSLAEYNAVLRSFNVIADRGAEDSVMFAKRGLVYALLDPRGNRIGIPFKASSLAGKPTLNKVENKYAFNAEKRKINAEPLKSIINDVLDVQAPQHKKSLIKELGKQGVSLRFRESSEGKVYGVTYVDHSTRSVFNGSDLGKKYSAKAIVEKLAQNKQEAEKMPVQFKADREIKQDILSYKHTSAKTSPDLLHFLMEKPAYDPAVSAVPVRKKRKKKKGLSRNNTLSNRT